MKQMQKLETLFEVLGNHVSTCEPAFISVTLKHSVEQHAGHDAKQLRPWIADWTSPFHANERLAGLLHPKGTQHYPPHFPNQHHQALCTVC